MLLKRPTYRRFDYSPRYYKPQLDKKVRFKEQMRRERMKARRKSRPVIVWGVILFLVVYAYIYLSGVGR
jgi:hypothetical protein